MPQNTEVYASLLPFEAYTSFLPYDACASILFFSASWGGAPPIPQFWMLAEVDNNSISWVHDFGKRGTIEKL